MEIGKQSLIRPNYGMLYPVDLLREKVVDKGLWFWPGIPQIDEDGIPDFSAIPIQQTITISLSVAVVIMAETLLAENSFCSKK